MKVFIANFGRGNYAWPMCLNGSTIATMNDASAHPFWLAGDREGYIDFCVRNAKTAAGLTPTRPVASRWFNLMTIVGETTGDTWIHREGDELWWTESLPDEPTISASEEPLPDGGTKPIFICQKPCSAWSRTTRLGARLTWKGLHPKASEFLFTEGTLQQLSPDHAEYALALIAGADLMSWHDRAVWTDKAKRVGRGEVATGVSARRKAVLRMAGTAADTVANSNGQQVLRRVKNKELRFTPIGLEIYIDKLIDAQEGLCAITGFKLQFDSEHDDSQMLCSLDRIDSDGHYEEGNLQIVCRFVNRWKSDEKDCEFRRLITLVRASALRVT